MIVREIANEIERGRESERDSERKVECERDRERERYIVRDWYSARERARGKAREIKSEI